MKQRKQVKLLIGNEIEDKINSMYNDENITVVNVEFTATSQTPFALVEYTED